MNNIPYDPGVLPIKPPPNPGDIIDGSSGFTFTYIPVIFEDDCQICKMISKLVLSDAIKYKLRFEIIDHKKEIA